MHQRVLRSFLEKQCETLKTLLVCAWRNHGIKYSDRISVTLENDENVKNFCDF